MNTETLEQPDSDNAVLVLYPPDPVDSNKSVVGADCGIAINYYDLTPMGAKVRVDPYDGQAPLDTVSLNLNGELNIASTQTQSTDDAVILYIPKNKLLSGADIINELTYTVTRGSQNQGTSEPPLRVLYYGIRPGKENRVPGGPGHSELKLIFPQDVLDYGIDADRAEQGVHVCFEYTYCGAFNTIRLNCNGHDVFRKVTADEAPLTPTAAPLRICLTLTKADLEQVKDDPQAVFNYTVDDQVGNGPDPDCPWSGRVLVTVDMQGVRLLAPDITEDPDDPNDAPETIDKNKLGAKDLTIQVHVLSPPWAVNDVIRVKYVAAPNSGGAPVEHEVEAPVVRIPFVQKLMIPNGKVIADSVVRVSYEQVREDTVIARSRVASARVILAPVITSAKDLAGIELENGGPVSHNKIILQGAALAGALLEIFDGATFVEEVRTGTDYKWTSTAISIAVGLHVLTAREKEGNQLVSEPWAVQRLAFSIDRTQMKLNGFSVKVDGWAKTGEDSIGNTGLRLPTGGVPPIDWASSDPLTASVTAGGKVSGLKGGVATIYATDQEGTTLSFLAAVTNKFKLEVSPTGLTPMEAEQWMRSLGGIHTYNGVFRSDLLRTYVPPVRTDHTWTCGTFGRWHGYLRGDYSFNTVTQPHVWTAWCLVPM
ncbi:Ig-like domain-containing protein [Pseudomonas sp. TWP3-2]|uniref:Ig-like domain-containing protein n=1 Tax=Pseudomonas sp. TWP3-2 TaxID=2804574 RepID=UPI003CED2046